MKKTLILLISLFLAQLAFAQKGEFIYVDFEPDLCVKVDHQPIMYPYPTDTLRVDFDHDGTIDLLVSIYMLQTGQFVPEYHTTWDCLRYKKGENDVTIPSESLWNHCHDWGYYYFTIETYWEDLIGFKKTVDDVSYYAWLRIYVERIIHGIGGSYDKMWVYIDKYAYCSIPDYPLQWGQTSLNWSVEENTEVSTSVHPNPATDCITIDLPNEEDCQSIEIFSIDGRLVETFPEMSQQTTIDISGLNAGMYIMKIKMVDGREFSEKIVKE